MVNYILVASYTNDITTLSFDSASGSLDVSSEVNVGHHPSWLTTHKSRSALVFTALHQSDGKIVTLRYDENGKGSVVSEAPSGGQDPCSLIATQNEILVANVRKFLLDH
jgi:6-phosphogluconolactonase (cycloisomerase 2 family)